MTFRKMQGEGRERGESQNFDRFCGWFQMVFGERVGKSFGRLWTSHVQQAILFLFIICKDLLQFFSFCLDSYLWCSSMMKTHDA